MDKLADNYNFLVVDNEAGMEHISRVTTQHIDLLYVVSDPSRRSVTAAGRVKTLAEEMKVLKGPPTWSCPWCAARPRPPCWKR